MLFYIRKDTKVGIDVPINNTYININRVAEAKGLKSNRSLRLEINKPESKYIAREVKVMVEHLTRFFTPH